MLAIFSALELARVQQKQTENAHCVNCEHLRVFPSRQNYVMPCDQNHHLWHISAAVPLKKRELNQVPRDLGILNYLLNL
jgi:hypothetical protein